jgi:hypothetical protein
MGEWLPGTVAAAGLFLVMVLPFAGLAWLISGLI